MEIINKLTKLENGNYKHERVITREIDDNELEMIKKILEERKIKLQMEISKIDKEVKDFTLSTTI